MEVMKKILTVLLSLSAACGSLCAQQTLRSAYFLDGYNFRHDMNPAFAAERSYFSVGLGRMNVETQSNLGVNNFLFPNNGELTTFMSSSVSPDSFLGNLKERNRLNASVDFDIFSLGIRTEDAFWSFGVNMKMNAGVNIPYSLFEFAKNTGASQMYDISSLSARVNSYVEFALGYSRQISDIVNVGARLKFLVGLANADVNVEKMKVRMDADKWSVESKGKMDISAKFLDIRTKGETGAELDDPSDRNLIDFSDGIGSEESPSAGSFMNGYGAAVDLGAEAEIIPGLRVSLALNDLGFISWKNTVKAETSGKGWSFDGFSDVSFDGGKDNSLSEQFKNLGDDLADMLDFERTEKSGKKMSALAAVLNAAVEYEMPFYSALTAGFLSSTRFNGPYTYTEGRVFANLKPTKWFSFSLNYAISNLGSSMGGVIGFHTSGFSMFIGADSIPFAWANAGSGLLYPYRKANVGVNFGLSFNVGMRHERKWLRPLVTL